VCIPPITRHSADQSKLSYLVQNIRFWDPSSNNSAGGSGSTKDWNLNIEEKETELGDDLRKTSGIGRKRKRVCELAHACVFVKTPTEGANDGASPLSKFAPLYGDGNETYVFRVMATHLRHDADEWDRLARQLTEHEYNQQALYCYQKYTVSTRQMSTRCGIEHCWRGRSEQ
jgi:hypothetical protein